MANTDIVRSLPENSNGISVVSSATSWAFGSWVLLHQDTGIDINIISLRYCITYQPAATDTIYEHIFELGVGDQGSEITKIQIPHSIKEDTAANYYMHDHTCYLPEMFFLPKNSRISVRVANGVATSTTYNGLKIMYMAANKLVAQSDSALPNNYQFARSVSAGVISMSERIR